ncbi:DUF6745 domain-containing protein [Sinosporangium siamense]|uniref:DUF6745 domain-containing protein n=1 Tax=Sinosporangium siamense TaxID=1367973 RepID=A0A919V550_9ACTN|nr:hypothetical protein [Sinosporangium siamense]GII90451.1 hypothetical protein Ssi02_06820 [Sinosporangium siamense]
MSATPSTSSAPAGTLVSFDAAAALVEAADRWSTVAFATGGADRDRAEAGIRRSYQTAGLSSPERVVWVPSPAHGAIAALLVTGQDLGGFTEGPVAAMVAEVRELVGAAEAGQSVRRVVRDLPWEAARSAAVTELGPQGWAHAWSLTGGRLWPPTSSLVTQVRRAIGELVPEQDDAKARMLREATLDAILGHQDAAWLAVFDGLVQGGGATEAAWPEGLAALAEVTRAAGWWWPFERLVIAAELPVELHRDELARLHRGDGPALAYQGGFALHAWSGMPVPGDFIATLPTATPADIREQDNAELRRVMLEHYGFDRYLTDTGAKPVQKDETGVLWRVDMPNDEPVVMVEVVNSTPEPDGTSRRYWLRVPPSTETARAGVAWTFGVEPDDYSPLKQT